MRSVEKNLPLELHWGVDILLAACSMTGECRKVKSKYSLLILLKGQPNIFCYLPNAEPRFVRKSKHAVSKLFPGHCEAESRSHCSSLVQKRIHFWVVYGMLTGLIWILLCRQLKF